MALRRTPFYRVLYRPPLFLGGEREPVLALALACALMVYGFYLVPMIVAVFLWLGGITAFRLMAKADPFMTRIYTRQWRYKSHYSPRSRPARTE
jgi:type IV secretory pathway TrbD component